MTWMHQARAHTHRAQIDTITAENPMEEVRKTPKKPEPPNSPIGPKIRCQGEVDGSGNCADASTVRTDMQSVETNLKPTKDMSKNVRTSQLRPRTQS